VRDCHRSRLGVVERQASTPFCVAHDRRPELWIGRQPHVVGRAAEQGHEREALLASATSGDVRAPPGTDPPDPAAVAALCWEAGGRWEQRFDGVARPRQRLQVELVCAGEDRFRSVEPADFERGHAIQ
jgi:hypothetical protein